MSHDFEQPAVGRTSISVYLTRLKNTEEMKKWGLLLILLWFGCLNHPSAVIIKVSLTDSNRSLQISGFDKEVINDIAQNSADSAWQALLPVYKMPVDTDMKDFQNTQPGKYAVKDSLVIFTPDTAFKKGQVYFVR